MSTATEATISCRVCGIDNWLNCGCYNLHGGAGGLGDMNADYKFIHCPLCDYTNGHYPDCESQVKQICKDCGGNDYLYFARDNGDLAPLGQGAVAMICHECYYGVKENI